MSMLLVFAIYFIKTMRIRTKGIAGGEGKDEMVPVMPHIWPLGRAQSIMSAFSIPLNGTNKT